MYQHANASIWGKIQRIFIAILHEETADVKSLESGQYFPDAKVKKKKGIVVRSLTVASGEGKEN